MIVPNPVAFAIYLHELSKENDRIVALLDEKLGEGAQVAEMRQACFSSQAGWLVLLDNEWDRCEVDRVRMKGAVLAGGHGFKNICPGRHLVTTALPSGTATLDTLVYPGEMVAVRLDEDRAVWSRIDHDEAMELARRITAGMVQLYGYYELVAAPRLAAALQRARDEILPAIDASMRQVAARLDQGEHPSRLAPTVAQLAGALVGLPLPSFEPIATPLAAGAWRRATEGKHDGARLVAQMGLALLPGEASLLAALCAIEAKEGSWDKAMAFAMQAREHADEKTMAWLSAIFENAPR